jgi:hypothetical protein
MPDRASGLARGDGPAQQAVGALRRVSRLDKTRPWKTADDGQMAITR